MQDRIHIVLFPPEDAVVHHVFGLSHVEFSGTEKTQQMGIVGQFSLEK